MERALCLIVRTVTTACGRRVAIESSPCSGRLTRWRSLPGERVRTGDPVCVVETDGEPHPTQLRASSSGLLQRQLQSEGAVVRHGDPVCIVDPNADATWIAPHLSSSSSPAPWTPPFDPRDPCPLHH